MNEEAVICQVRSRIPHCLRHRDISVPFPTSSGNLTTEAVVRDHLLFDKPRVTDPLFCARYVNTYDHFWVERSASAPFLGIKDGYGGLSSPVSHSTFSTSDFIQPLPLPLIMHQSTIFAVLTAFLLSAPVAPMPLDNTLNKRLQYGRVRRLSGYSLRPHTDHWPPREHGSRMVWVHVVNGTATLMPLSRFQARCMAQEVIVAE